MMNKQKLLKKKYWIISIILLIILSIKIPLPTFWAGHTDFHGESLEHIKKSKRDIYFYKPLCDTLLIQDSLRNIRFHVKEACAYQAQWLDEVYIRSFLPWVKIVNFEDLYFLGIWFDRMEIREKRSTTMGIWFSIDTISHSSEHSLEKSWDDIERDFSYYGARMKAPLSDTVYFTVWGYPGLYVDSPTYKSLSEEERLETISLAGKLKNTKQILGEITFVKSDSIIYSKKRKAIEKKLLFNL